MYILKACFSKKCRPTTAFGRFKLNSLASGIVACNYSGLLEGAYRLLKRAGIIGPQAFKILLMASGFGILATGIASPTPASAGCGPLGLFKCPPGPWPEWAIRNNARIVQRNVVDPVYYADEYADLRKAFSYDHFALKKHWVEHGIKECRRSSPVFDVRYYLNSYADLQRAFGRDNCVKAVVHWYEHGISEGRQGHPNFSPKCYLDRYPDLQRAFGNQNYAAAIEHYYNYGRNENRNGQCG